MTWTIRTSIQGQGLASPLPMTVILGADRIDALGGTDGDTGAALEVHAGVDPADPDALTLLAYRAGQSAQEGPQQIRLQDWAKIEHDEDALVRRIQALAGHARHETAQMMATLEQQLTPAQLRAFNEAAAAYLPYLQRRVREGGPERATILSLARRLHAGEALVLVCWCAPAACHTLHVMAAVQGYASRLAAQEVHHARRHPS